MKRTKHKQTRHAAWAASNAPLLLTSLLAAGTLTGCVVMGTSSRGGFFIWPGGLGLVVLILLVLLVLRRR